MIPVKTKTLPETVVQSGRAPMQASRCIAFPWKARPEAPLTTRQKFPSYPSTLLFALWLATMAPSVLAQPAPISGKPGYHPDRILVKTAPNLSSIQAKTISSSQKTRILRAYPDMGGWQVVQLPPGASVTDYLARFRDIQGIEYAEPDYRVRACLEPTDPDYQRRALWGLHNTNDVDIDAPEGWEVRHTAADVVVAVVDSGIRTTHEDLAANLWVNMAEIPNNGVDDDGNGYVDDLHGINAIDHSGTPSDDNGHGTHVAGIIGAVGDNGKGITGVAWKVQLMACKFLNYRGEGYISDAIACLDYARRHGAHILNLSWSDAEFSFALQSALARARDASILIVAAAGNQKSDNDAAANYPSCFELDNLVAVASASRSGEISRTSNYGLRQVDLAAPGDSIYSTYYSWDFDYASTGGTSMAAAYVSGVLALLKAEFPGETCQQLISRLLASAKPLDQLRSRCRSGGLVSLGRALSQPSILDFASSPLTGAAPFIVSFTNTSASPFNAFRWDFGDGSPVDETPHPIHLYSREGRYQVTLQGNDANGLSHRRVRQVVALANYQIEPASMAWIAATNHVLSLSNDGASPPIRLPFLFPFYGQDHEFCHIGANGVLRFSGEALSNPVLVLPHQDLLGPVIWPCGIDLDPSQGGTVSYGMEGTPPHRRFIVTWEGVPYHNQPEIRLTFQVILSEETGEIHFQYLQVATLQPGSSDNFPIIGVRDPSGQVVALYERDRIAVSLTNGLALRLAPTTGGGLRVTPLFGAQIPARSQALGQTRAYTLFNTSGQALTWRIDHTQNWLSLSSSNGMLDPGHSAALTLTVNSEAASLEPGLYQDYLHFNNLVNGQGNTTRCVALWIRQVESILLQIKSVQDALALRVRGEPRLLCRIENSPDMLQWFPLVTNRLSSSGEWLLPESPIASHPNQFYRAVELWELPDVNAVGSESGVE